MKKRLFSLLFTLSILSACNSSTLSFSEIDTVPSDVQDKIDSKYVVQLIDDGEDTSYIVFHSKGTVTATIEAKRDTIQVKVEENNQQNDVMKQYVYKLTKDPEHERIDLYINGESTPIDHVTGI
ncbi:peptidylprolyl isomerase [Peribacillus asahii]|uniref:peptidylprolyl isomerase n=1 Tax=Peribacillus asahii TaxID=228899 RepID=UPI00207A8061|nr:peptidylprolyl isomerase [Peribacillus asahii]USK62487.1 peptidylprolyl isomerase [Peribacillus asahii]